MLPGYKERSRNYVKSIQQDMHWLPIEQVVIYSRAKVSIHFVFALYWVNGKRNLQANGTLLKQIQFPIECC